MKWTRLVFNAGQVIDRGQDRGAHLSSKGREFQRRVAPKTRKALLPLESYAARPLSQLCRARVDGEGGSPLDVLSQTIQGCPNPS